MYDCSSDVESDRSRISISRRSLFAILVRQLIFIWLTITSIVSGIAASSVVGPPTVCPGTTNLFSVLTDSTNGIYAWSIGTNNSAGAIILDDPTNASVNVFAPNNGEFTLDCLVDFGGTNELATTNVLVPGLVGGSSLTNQIACSGVDVVFAMTVVGNPNYTALWRKDGNAIAGATTETLTLTNVATADAGEYCLEVSGPCNSFTNCATLDLVSLASLNCPTNLLLQCLADVPAPDTNSVTATNANTVLFLGDSAATNGCEITITRTYGAVNSCGATSTCAQVIVVQDTTPPALTCTTNRTVECGTGWDFDTPTAFDICDGSNVVVSVLNTLTNPLCGGSFWAERTWLAVDACGNSNTCSQIITNVDTTTPVLTCATNRTVECGDIWNFDLPSALDACEGTNVTLLVLNTVTNPICGESFWAERSWLAVDACGNSNMCSQIITNLDTTAPVLTCATNRTVECGDTWDFDPPTALDACEGTNVTLLVLNTATNALCGGSFWAERTWLAVDACGNSNTCSQVITNLDTTAPVLTCATNRTVECGDAWDFDLPSGLDACEGTNVAVVVLDTTTNLTCGNTFVATRTWQATDSCTNVATCSQTITVIDTVAPALTCATNRLVECGSAWDFDPPSALDICDGSNVTVVVFNTVTNLLCGNTFEATRTWQATDSCTNVATCSQTITVVDITPPTLTCVTNRTVECGNIWDFDVPSADDSCSPSNVVVSVLNTVTNPICGGSFWTERTWLAVDACGNSNTCSQVITNLDTTAPVLTCGTNRTIECGDTWDFDPPTALDACEGTNVTVVILDTVTNSTCGNTFVATRTWQATDGCTNISTCSQTIAVVDTTPPLLSCGTNRIVECASAWDFDVPTATDVCGGTNVIIELVSTVTNQLIGETFAATQIWKATDACSNSITCSQTVTLVDLTLPIIICPSNVVVECAGFPGTQMLFDPVAFDTCDTNVTIVSVPPSGSFFTLGTNAVVCTATDDSGNSNQCSFTITVIDTTPPQITCPSNMIVAEAPRDSGGAAVPFTPIASDICDSVPAIVSLPASGSIFPVGYTTVQNTATDGSGNTNSCSFTVRVIAYRLYVLNTNDAGPGSLREAMLDANDSPDANLILFNISGAGVQTIQPLSPLPQITSPVTIDGWSQPGFSNAPLIQINGGLAGANVVGLHLVAGTNAIRGLVLNGFTTAIRIETNGGNVIQNNYIGTSSSGNSAAPNSGDGIFIDSINNLIGGYSGSGNIIAFNGGNGVALSASAGNNNAIVGNSIHSNTGLGIDIGSDGPTPNDNDDPDFGPNRLQNFPVLSDATFDSGITVISGTLNSLPSRTYRIDFFLNDVTNSSGFGEGQKFIGSLDQFVHSDGNGDFVVSFVVPATYVQFVTATATDSDGNTSEFSPPVQVATPPVVETQPTNTIIYAGSNLTICASASGTPPIFWQWRRNGQNIPGATNQCYTIPIAQAGDGGNYTCAIRNGLGALGTTAASYFMSLPQLAGGDNFVDRVPLTGGTGIVAGSTLLATRELGEPLHANKPGGKSVWYKWIAPHHGIMTVGTPGSDFDTLLAVYNVVPNKLPFVTNLVAVASDEDGGGYFTSGMRFNVAKDREYEVAIDGFSGDSGAFALNWSFEKTGYPLPKIWTNPVSQTVHSGANVTFSVFAVPVCGSAKENCQNPSHYDDGVVPGILYQWLFNGVPISGETNQQLFLPNAGIDNVGNYSVLVSQYNSVVDRTIESPVASLQVNDTEGGIQTVQFFDKYQDAFNSTPLQLGGLAQPQSVPEGQIGMQAIIVAGYSGSQVFNTTAGTSQGEIFCGVVGGSSEWLNFVPGESGVLSVNTDGSSFDTLLAVLQSNVPPMLLGCDNNSGFGGTNSSLVVPVVAGKNYLIGVDGVNGAFGRVVLNYNLNPSAASSAPKITNVGTTNGLTKFRINSITNKFVIHVSTNLAAWVPLSTNAAPVYIYDYVDYRSTNFPRRFYRVQVVP